MLQLGFWERHRTLNYDIETYYHYLPATFIHHDVRDLRYVAALDSLVLHPGEGQVGHGIQHSTGTGHDVLKVTYGVSLFEAPLFLVAHALCKLPASKYEADGYSPPYQLAVSQSTILFTFLALLLLRAFLLRHASDGASSLALIVIAFGTNLYFYSTIDSGMSHAYLFFLFAAVLERTDAWHRSPTRGKAIGLGLALGLILLTRPIDIIVVVVPLLWTHDLGLRAKWKLVQENASHIVFAAIAALLPLIPQLLYWKATTGQFIHYAYQGEGFNWTDPHIVDGLFSYRKGWFVWSPLVVLGLVGSAMMLLRKEWRSRALPLMAFYPPAVYAIFSWHEWWYGGGFGSRPMVDSLPLLALPMAVLFEQSVKRRTLIHAGLVVIVLAGVRLNLFQQDQYKQTIIRWDGMTKDRYWEVWGHGNWVGLKPFLSPAE